MKDFFRNSYPLYIVNFLLLIPLFWAHQLLAESPTSSAKAESKEWKNPFKPDEVDKAIESGIQYLLTNQKDDGAIYDRGNPTSITALSVMALAAVGHLPIHPNENGEAMAQALEFLLLEKIKMKSVISVRMEAECTDMELLL